MALLSRLSLTNFRNFRQTDIDLSPGVSVFHGPNAQGKTALLEAAYTLAVGRAFRAEREREVVNFEAARCGDAAYITGVAVDGEQPLTVVVGYQPSGSTAYTDKESNPTPVPPAVNKQIRVNRRPSTAAGLVGRVPATLFVVDDLDLVLGAPAGRRRYLDVLISQGHRTYLYALQKYQAALRNRNGLLRRRRDGWVDPDELEYWNAQLVQAGTQIVLRRASALTKIAALAQTHHSALAEPDQALDLAYRPNVPHLETVEATEAEFGKLLKQRDARERATAVTATGPHRDDFNISVDGHDAGAFASRGQARTIALALRLAEADYLAEARSEDPIILLDDVFSEMDSERRERILRKTATFRQALITTTDVEPVRAVLGRRAAYFRVLDNTVVPESPTAAAE